MALFRHFTWIKNGLLVDVGWQFGQIYKHFQIHWWWCSVNKNFINCILLSIGTLRMLHICIGRQIGILTPMHSRYHREAVIVIEFVIYDDSHKHYWMLYATWDNHLWDCTSVHNPCPPKATKEDVLKWKYMNFLRALKQCCAYGKGKYLL